MSNRTLLGANGPGVDLEAATLPTRGLSARDARVRLGDLMAQFVALLRGIGPTNPNMHNDKLRAVLEGLGLTRVRPILASGNLVFSSSARDTGTLEAKIERALTAKLGLSVDVLVRSQDQLEKMAATDPFDGAEHGKKFYLTVTFFKDRTKPVFTKLEHATMDGPRFMADLEKRYGKRITTRTWNTVQKIVAKMRNA